MRIALLLTGLLAWPAFGGDCFCLVNADDEVWFDCREQTRPLRTQPLLFCLDATTKKQVELTGHQDFTRVADGNPPCTPCRLSDATALDHGIRGAGEDKPKAPPASVTQPADGEERP